MVIGKYFYVSFIQLEFTLTPRRIIRITKLIFRVREPHKEGEKSMRKTLIVALVLMVCASVAFAAAFSPAVLSLSAPSKIQYNFDGSNLEIPVTVTGTPASVIFLLFTNGKSSAIQKVQNGYLGWHYVNKVDTCIYFQPAAGFVKGSNKIIWDGKGEGGALVPKGDYTYYLWGFDNISSRTLALWKYNPGSGTVIVEKDAKGLTLAQPYIQGMYLKWNLGSDPMDTTTVETTSLTWPTGWSGGGYGPFAVEPADPTMFFTSCWNKEAVVQGIAKWKWVPNGKAESQTSWGTNGTSTYTATLDAEPGVVTDGTYLYSGDSNHHLADAMSKLYVFEFDGSIAKSFDLTDWWSDPDDLAAKGQMNGGPTTYHMRDGHLFFNCHCSCIKQMVNPLAEDDADFVVWTNQNGDYTFDHNFETTSTRAWVCNDFNVGPYTYNIYTDSNLFSICPSFDMGAVSIGLMAPDGTGLGYYAWAGETAAQKSGNMICDNGSAYDGVYTSLNESGAAAVKPGIYFIGQDSIKGIISSQVSVADAVPAVFAVAQNTPNPFNPTTSISFTLAKAGKVTVDVFNAAGQKIDTIANGTMSAGSHTLNWNASRFSAGVYFYTVKAGNVSKTMKMTLLK